MAVSNGPAPKFKPGDRVVITLTEETTRAPGACTDMVNVARRGGEHIVKHCTALGWVTLEGNFWAWHPDWLEHAYEVDSL